MKLVSGRIVSNIELIPGYSLLCIEASYIAATARPGQFITIKCGEETLLRRPFSIHKTAGADLIFVFFKIVGKGTMWLSQRACGEVLDTLGPLGNGFSIPMSAKNLLLIAGGTGIAPLVFLAQQASAQGKNVKLVIGAKTAEQLYPEGQLPSDIEKIFVTEDASKGEKGTVTQFLARNADDLVLWSDQIYACGPLAMYQEIERQNWHRKKAIQISLEIRMGCGIGACYGCSLMTRKGMKQVCKDGPVFDIEDILWEEVRI